MCMETLDTKKEFSLMRRARSFANAGRGLTLLFKTTPNLRIHLVILIAVVVLGFYFGITTTEWIFIVLSAGLVLTTETVNTAIEIDINLTSPEYHPYARDTKDVAAGAVLIASLVASIVGLIIFIPYII